MRSKECGFGKTTTCYDKNKRYRTTIVWRDLEYVMMLGEEELQLYCFVEKFINIEYLY